MKAFFTAPTPRFGRVNNRLPVGHQQRSPYYWWWACLRQNAAYLDCCEQGGKGKLSKLYADFGDVRADDFHKWWTEGNRGVELFADKPLTVRFGELATADEWNPSWNDEGVLLVAVPLQMSKRSLKGAFAKLLDARHTGKQGRPAVDNTHTTAQYKLHQNYTIPSLRLSMSVYEMSEANKHLPKEKQLTLWEIGAALNLNKQAAKDALSEHKPDRVVGRNVLAVTASRYKRQAQRLIANAAEGRFPDYS
jgi:hypothetical protein